jgi:hypothetical protein
LLHAKRHCGRALCASNSNVARQMDPLLLAVVLTEVPVQYAIVTQPF